MKTETGPLPLLDWATTHARRTDPRTSHAAAEQSETLASRHHRIIVDALRRCGPSGMTYEDIAIATGLEKHAVGKRLGELERSKLAMTKGEERTLSTRRKGRVWYPRFDE